MLIPRLEVFEHVRDVGGRHHVADTPAEPIPNPVVIDPPDRARKVSEDRLDALRMRPTHVEANQVDRTLLDEPSNVREEVGAHDRVIFQHHHMRPRRRLESAPVVREHPVAVLVEEDPRAERFRERHRPPQSLRNGHDSDGQGHSDELTAVTAASVADDRPVSRNSTDSVSTDAISGFPARSV